jgi:hypothetical protein
MHDPEHGSLIPPQVVSPLPQRTGQDAATFSFAVAFRRAVSRNDAALIFGVCFCVLKAT